VHSYLTPLLAFIATILLVQFDFSWYWYLILAVIVFFTMVNHYIIQGDLQAKLNNDIKNIERLLSKIRCDYR